MTTKRKIIQIATVPEGDSIYPHAYALCDDGTLWAMPLAAGAGSVDQLDKWKPVPAVPDIEPPAEDV